MDNRNSRYVGPWQGSASHSINGVVAPFDQIRLRGITSTDNQELQAGEIAYLLPLNTQGTTLRLSAVKSWSEPGYTLTPFALENQNLQIGATLSHPVYRSAYENLFASTRFTLSDSKGKSLGALFSEDRVRSLGMGLQYDNSDRFGGSSLLTVNATQGLPFLNASGNHDPNRSRANGRSDFTKINLSASHSHPLGQGWEVMAATSGQAAFTQLLSGEEFSIGGGTFGRGYDPSEITGDHGLASLLEIRYRPAFTSAPAYLSRLQGYASYDYGSVWRIDSNNRDAHLTAASAALGLRLTLSHGLNLDTQVAKPLTRQVSSLSGKDANDPRFFFSMIWGF